MKRYNLSYSNYHATMVPYDHGAWVEYQEAQRLEAELAEVTKQKDYYAMRVAEMRGYHEDICSCEGRERLEILQSLFHVDWRHSGEKEWRLAKCAGKGFHWEIRTTCPLCDKRLP